MRRAQHPPPSAQRQGALQTTSWSVKPPTMEGIENESHDNCDRLVVHSSEHVDWHSALRIHPLERVVMGVATASFLLILGFPLKSMAMAAPVAGLVGILIHLDCNVDLGPLRFVIATPAFHRWHHADDEAAYGKNLAGVFPVWDLLFGTFYMPRRSPDRFGAGEAVPGTLLGQLLYPFRHRRRA